MQTQILILNLGMFRIFDFIYSVVFYKILNEEHKKTIVFLIMLQSKTLTYVEKYIFQLQTMRGTKIHKKTN